MKKINVKEIPAGLSFTEFVVEAQKQTGITYIGHTGKRIAQQAYGGYLNYWRNR